MARKPVQTPAEPDTTGHVWDGIEEYNNPLPRWWLWTFYGTIVWAIGYTIAYPAWPLVTGATPGLLGYSSRAEVAEAIRFAEAANADLNARLLATPLADIPADPELLAFATAGGAAVFRTFCAQCHGAGAAGVQAAGYPNLLDDDWLWGGSLEDIHAVLQYGIRWEAEPDTRWSMMPVYGGFLEPEEIAGLAEHVLSLSGQDHDAAAAALAAPLYLEQCASCHGDGGEGVRDQGGPALNDAISLYGAGREAIIAQITAPQNGIMPSWAGRLSEEDIRKAAVFVHGLGGGE